MNANPTEPSDVDPPEPLTLPLDDWHRARGARMVAFAGYAMPLQYEGIIAEHLWTRENAGLFDVSHMGQLAVSGTGAIEALESLLPADVSGLKAGRVRYSLLLDENGGILDDLMITRAGEDYHLVVNGATKWDDIAYLREHLPDEVTLTLLEDEALLALQGPKAAEALMRIGVEPESAGSPQAHELRFMQTGTFQWNGNRLGISRTGYTGEDGFEISIAASDVAGLADALTGQPEVKPAGLGARDSLRLEAGLPLYGHDLTVATDPVSAGLAFAIPKRRRTDGGYPGAERIQSLLTGGPERVRVGLSLEGRMAAREGALVLASGREVGRVTSGGFAPSLNHAIAMAYVDASYAEPGTAVELENRGRLLNATVVPLPFRSHRYYR